MKSQIALDGGCTGLKKNGMVRRYWRSSARLGAVVSLIFLNVAAWAQTPAGLTDLGATAPVPGPNDISQLSISGQTEQT